MGFLQPFFIAMEHKTVLVEVPAEILEATARIYRVMLNETRSDTHEARIHYSKMLVEHYADILMWILEKHYLHNWLKDATRK